MCREVSQPLEGAITVHLTPHFHRNGPKGKVLGLFVESWKSSPFDGIPQPHRKYSEKNPTIKILSSASFKFPATAPPFELHGAAASAALSEFKPNLRGWTPRPRAAPWQPCTQTAEQASCPHWPSLSVRVSSFPLGAHTPDVRERGKRRLLHGQRGAPAAFTQHSTGQSQGGDRIRGRRRRSQAEQEGRAGVCAHG